MFSNSINLMCCCYSVWKCIIFLFLFCIRLSVVRPHGRALCLLFSEHKPALCYNIPSHPTSPIHTIMSIFFFWFFFSFFIGYIYMFHNMLNYGMTDTMCNVQAVVRQEFIQLRYRITFIND